MAPYTGSDYIADQLRASAPDANWDAADVDRAHELARVLWQVGIRDLSKLKLVKVTIPSPYAFLEEEPRTSWAFDYEGRKLGYLGEVDRVRVEPYLQEDSGRYRVLWSAEGHGAVSYFVVPRSGGFVFWPTWGSTSDLPFIREMLTTSAIVLTSFVLPLAQISPAMQIGAAILPAGTSPAVAALVGNVALSTAFNGGNIESAVESALKNAATGNISGIVGAQVGDLADNPLVGRLAASATRARISGGDVDRAVAMTLVQNGGDVVDWFNDDPAPPVSFGGDFDGDPYNTGFISDEAAPPVSFGGDFDGDPYNTGFISDEAAPPIVADTPTTDAPDADRPFRAPSLSGINAEPPQAPRSDSFTWGNARDIINTVSAAATSALRLNQAFSGQASSSGGAATVVTQARRVNADGTVTSALSDGTVQTRTADGRVVTARPPVGVAQSTVDGRVIVNNGNGTYDLISSNGQRRTIQYGENSGSDGFDITKIPIGVWFGVAGLAISLFKN